MSDLIHPAKSFFYPPGGILIWVIVIVELISFGVALIIFAASGSAQPDLFHESRQHLNILIGSVNTVILLTSGYLVAQAVYFFRLADGNKAALAIRLAMALGILFILLKTIEYFAKVNAGYTLSTNVFFTFYWFLTAFHALHVAAGLVILGFISHQVKLLRCNREDLEATAVFWHLCDVLWLLIFPVIYLLF